jgi:hypothetical protein
MSLYKDPNKNSKNDESIIREELGKYIKLAGKSAGIDTPFVDFLQNSYGNLENFADGTLDNWKQENEMDLPSYQGLLESLYKSIKEEIGVLEKVEYDELPKKLPDKLDVEKESYIAIIEKNQERRVDCTLQDRIGDIALKVRDNLGVYQRLGLIGDYH